MSEDDLYSLTAKELQKKLKDRGIPDWRAKKEDLIKRFQQRNEKKVEGRALETTNGRQRILSESNVKKVEEKTLEATSEWRENLSGSDGEWNGSGHIDVPENSTRTDDDIFKEAAMGSGKDETGGDSEQRLVQNNILLKDVQESLEKFDGENGKNVREWLEEMDNVASVCRWNEVQKYLYGRQLLMGAAKLAVEAERNVCSWSELKAVLNSEFSSRESDNVYKILESTKKMATESLLEYMYKMKKIAARGTVETNHLISYIIAGIPDEAANKAILYQSRDFPELKKNFIAYEKFKADQRREKGVAEKTKRHNENFNKGGKGGAVSKFSSGGGVGSSGAGVGSGGDGNRRCHNCGAKSHWARDCPNRERGTRCFKCNEFGHIAPNCTTRQNKDARVNRIKFPDITIEVKIRGKFYKAMLDTGSDISIMRQWLMNDFNITEFDGAGTGVIAFGDSSKATLGYISLDIEMEAESYKLDFDIVPSNWIGEDIILGKNILQYASIFIERGKLTTYKAKEDDDKLVLAQVNLLKYDQEPFELKNLRDPNYRRDIHQWISSYTPKSVEVSCVKMYIHLDDEKPIFQKPRRLAPKEREIVNNQIQEWLDCGIVQHSSSEYSSPVVLAVKKDGTHRLCVDYRKINSKVIRDRYPLPNIEEILEGLYKSRVFTTLDLRNGFFHVDIDEPSRKYTSFVTPDGQYEFTKAPFGLCNSPAAFQRYINTIFRELIRTGFVLVYIDDVIIPANDEADSMAKLKTVLGVCEENGLNIKWEKCVFLEKSVEFLGHRIEDGAIRPSDVKTQAVKKFPRPKDTHDVMSFLGLTGFFRKFVQDYAQIARPLTELTKRNVAFVWGEKENEAFMMLKEKLCDEPVLKLFNPNLPTQLHTDASKQGYGAVLLQKHEDYHPVFYLSYKTKSAEKNYSSYDLEVLAIVKALKRFRIYLLGIKFEIFTDCKAFQLTMAKKTLNSRVAHWAMQIEEFDCKVNHRSGISMRHVDALSRNPVVMRIEDAVLHAIKKAQAADETCQAVIKLLEKGEYDDFQLRSGTLCKFVEGNYLLVVPRSMRSELITKIHEKGHLSASKVEAVIKQEYYLPKAEKHIKKIISNCITCILASRKAGKQEGFLNPIEKVDIPLHTLHLDHLGPLPSTAKAYKYLLVVIDAFTKFTWIFPVKSTTTSEVLTKLEKLSETFGNPHRIITDKGTAFTSNDFCEYCDAASIIHHTTTTGVPRGNGQVERMNKIIIEIISKLSIADSLKWFQHVGRLQQLINSTTTRSTKRTPFELMFGAKMFCAEDLDLKTQLEEAIVNNFEEERREIREQAKLQILKVQEENRKQYDKKRKAANIYRVGDLVAIQRTQFGVGLKLAPKYLGPYEVTRVKRNDRYEVRKVGCQEGPKVTSTAADYMKTWRMYENESDGESSETSDIQDGRM